MSTFKERLFVEKKELNEKISSLQSLDKSGVGPREQDLLQAQFVVMCQYLDVLNDRLELLPDEPATMPELTFGQKAVGLTFNHGEGEIFELVNKAKQICADAIDLMKEIENRSSDIELSKAGWKLEDYPLGMSTERIALSTIARRSLQVAQMNMVKAITWKD